MRNLRGYARYASVSRGLGTKFLLALVVGAVTTIVCTAVFGYRLGYQLRRDGAGTKMQRVAESISDQIGMSLDSAVQLMAQLAASAELREAVVEQNRRYEGLSRSEIAELALFDTLGNEEADRLLVEFASRNPGFRVLKALDREDGVVGTFAKRVSHHLEKKEEWWHQSDAADQGKVVVSEPAFSKNPGSAAVRIRVPIFSEGFTNFEGTMCAEYSLDHIISQFPGDEHEILAFLLADGEQRRLHVLSPPEMASSRSTDFHESGKRISPGKRGWSMVEFDQRGISAIAGFAPIKNSPASPPVSYKGRDWCLLTAVSESEVMAPLNSLFFHALGFGTAMLVLVSLGGLALVRRILGPIHVLQEGVQEIGEGNLEHRIDVRSGDEIEMLASEFNRMADRMRRTQEQLQRRTKELEQRVTQLRRLQAQLMQSER
ncbi:MAG: HAMP domain-containing protein, partial [Candidatus Hydrogenedentota bacterium]